MPVWKCTAWGLGLREVSTKKRPEPEGTWTVRHHHTGSRPHVQGSGKAPRVRHSARDLTDGGGLVLVRNPFDRLALAGWIDGRAKKEKDFFRPGLMSEVWIVPPLYGGGVMDDPPLLPWERLEARIRPHYPKARTPWERCRGFTACGRSTT